MSDLTARNHAIWSSGDWDRVADQIAGVGTHLLDVVGLQPGSTVLDVGTGSGSSVAIPAAARGARVVGADLTDAWFPAARRRAEAAGVDVEWVIADAEDLPFGDGAFDVVLSTFGHMFAPHHDRAAAELVRVRRAGGTVGFATWLPQGFPGRVFSTLREFVPPPPAGVQPPPLWGDREHVAGLFPGTPEFSTGSVHQRIDAVPAFVEGFAAHFGPLVAARPVVGDRWDELVHRIEAVAEETTDEEGLRSDYLLTVLRDGGA